MNGLCTSILVRIGACFCIFTGLAWPAANAQLSGLYQTAPGATAVYKFQYDNVHAVTLPLNLTVSFSGDNPTTSISATIVAPIIGVLADGTPLFPIAEHFPMRVTGTADNSQQFHGNLSISQYLFDWTFQPASGNELLLSGHIYWAGGRYEDTTITAARLVPSIAGDYNQDGTVDTADFTVWRNNEGTTKAFPNDPLGGTIGQSHYEQWRAHFGQSGVGGAGQGSTTPEPATLWMLMAGAFATAKLAPRHARPDRTGRAA